MYLELGLGASTRARTGLALGIGLGLGLTVGLKIVLVRIISVDSLGQVGGYVELSQYNLGGEWWGKVQLICHDSKLSTISRG